MLQCLNAAFIKRREYSTVRIAAFCKQLCTVALHAPSHTSAPLFAFVRQLSQRYPSIHQMMENEQDVITSGTYNPNVQDPEHSNPFATSAWELSLVEISHSSQCQLIKQRCGFAQNVATSIGSTGTSTKGTVARMQVNSIFQIVELPKSIPWPAKQE